MIKNKIIRTTHLSLKTFIYLLVPIVFFFVISSNSNFLFGLRTFVVQTGSMEPAIPTGSIIVTKNSNSYVLGDIITFKDKQNRTVAHRINQTIINGGQVFFKTKGDINNVVDLDLISESQIIGKNILVIPWFGKISTIVKTAPGFLLLLGIPTLIFVIFELKNIKSEFEKEIEKKLRSQMNLPVVYET